jgi:hypothetical protein
MENIYFIFARNPRPEWRGLRRLCYSRMFFLFLFFSLPAFGALGITAVPTLEMPSGARQCGMGETGVALADDQNVLSWNPAGLGIHNDVLKGAISMFGTSDVFDWRQRHYSLCYQFNKESRGGLGFDVNGLDYPVSTVDNYGRIISSGFASEHVLSFGWGFNFSELGIKNHYFGVAVKFINSEDPVFFLPGQEPGRALVCDLGYIWNIIKPLNFGISLQNMGGAILYTGREEPDALPFMVNLGFSYINTIPFNFMRPIDISVEFTMRRAFAHLTASGTGYRPDPFYTALIKDWQDNSFFDNMREILYSVGGEAVFFNSAAFRLGYFHDDLGKRQSFRYGLGARFFNHLRIDFFQMPAVWGNEVYRAVFVKKWGLEISLTNLLAWNKNDLKWWEQK